MSTRGINHMLPLITAHDFVAGFPVDRCMVCHDPVCDATRPFRSTTDDGEKIAACRDCIAEALGDAYGEILF